jgi:hypothetical protein
VGRVRLAIVAHEKVVAERELPRDVPVRFGLRVIDVRVNRVRGGCRRVVGMRGRSDVKAIHFTWRHFADLKRRLSRGRIARPQPRPMKVVGVLRARQSSEVDLRQRDRLAVDRLSARGSVGSGEWLGASEDIVERPVLLNDEDNVCDLPRRERRAFDLRHCTGGQRRKRGPRRRRSPTCDERNRHE